MASTTADAGPSSQTSAATQAAVFKRLHPDLYLQRFLAQGYRPDGRKISAWRDVSINVGSIGTAEGSALVRIGDTTIVCGIKAEIAEPSGAAPDEGFVVPNVDLPALSSPRFKPGPPGEEAQTMSNWLNDLLVSSRTLPPKSLVIAPGRSAWAIYIDVACINYDGNAYDAAVLAVMAALRNTRLPAAKYDESSYQTVCDGNHTYPLPLGRTPLSASFGVFESTYLLPDPTAFEEPLLPTTISIALDAEGRAAAVRQEGLGGVVGKSGAQLLLDDAWSAAEERVKELRQILEESSST